MHLLAFVDRFQSWWGGLGAAQTLFYSVGLLAGAVIIVLLLVAVIGLEHGDGDFTGDHGDDWGLLSLKPIVGFFLAFGWGGAFAINAGWSVFAASAFATLIGGCMMFGVAYVLRSTRKLQADGTIQLKNAVGTIATVYVSVPPGGQSGGQVTVPFSGRTLTLQALQAGATPIASGVKVRVTELIDQQTVRVESLG